MVAIVLDQLTLGYDRGPAVRALDCVFEGGLATAVVGPNGSGKSTLLKAMAGRQKPLSGALRLDGIADGDIAYLPQDPMIDRAFPISVEDFAALGFARKRGLFGGLSVWDRGRLAEAIAATGLNGLERRPIAALSGGQFQRAMFARTLVQDARAILMDEPFSALDAHTTLDLLDVVRRWSEDGRIVVLVLHDLDIAHRLCPRSLLLARDKIAWGPTEGVLTPINLNHAQALAREWPAEDAV